MSTAPIGAPAPIVPPQFAGRLPVRQSWRPRRLPAGVVSLREAAAARATATTAHAPQSPDQALLRQGLYLEAASPARKIDHQQELLLQTGFRLASAEVRDFMLSAARLTITRRHAARAQGARHE